MTETDLSTFDNSDYRPGGMLQRLLWYPVNLIFFQSKWFPFSEVKSQILSLFGAKMGKGVIIKPGVNIKYPWRLSIGDHTWVGEDVWIDNLGKVSIGAHCCLSQGALLLCGNHDYSSPSFDLMVGDITLENGVWIGARATVTGGVRCAHHSVLSVGSVASKDLSAMSIHGGSPAVRLRERKITSK